MERFKYHYGYDKTILKKYFCISILTMRLGILILAPANSIGDYVADTALAKNGKFATAFGAVYSGPLLNLLVGIGLSCTISTLANGIPVPLARTAVEVWV